jgi:putative ABC transport system permease protein
MKNLFNRLFTRRALDAEVREEIEAHVALRAEHNRAAGMPDDEAQREARRRFGNPASIREEIYHFNGFGILDALGRDLRWSLRTLGRSPGVAAAAILSLALGIGANTLAFSFVNVLLFRTLPYPSPDRIVMPDDPITPGECEDLIANRKDLFEDFGCFIDAPVGASIAGDNPDSSAAEHLSGQRFTAGVGRVLAVPPLVGRWFSDSEEQPARVAVISHRLWQRRFGGSPDVLNQTVRIDGEAVTIIGVLPDNFEFLNSSVDYWMPFRSQEFGLRNPAAILGAAGRLRSNVTVAQAQGVIDALVARRPPPASGRPARVRLTPMDDFVQAQLQDSALVLQGTVAFVLLIACANVAGLLLAQAVSRRRELAVHAALGSGTWRIVRQAGIHSVVLFCAGGLAGLAVAWAGIRVTINAMLLTISSVGEPRGGLPRGLFETSIDGNVLLFTFVVSVVFGLAAAIAPALQVSRAQPLDVLRESNRSATPAAGRQRLRSVFVTVQIALAFILLVGAALMLNGLARSLRQDIGFDTAGLLTAHVRLPNTRAGADGVVSNDNTSRLDTATRFTSEQIRQQLAGIAGVTSASGIAIYPPLSGAVNMALLVEHGQAQTEQRSQFLPVMPEYFKTLNVAVVHGREFGPGDSAESVPVAVVNEAAAARFWPNESPLGKRIRIQSPQLPSEPSRQVIGVVTEIMQYSGQETRPQIYVPFAQLQIVAGEQLNTQLRHITYIVRTPRPAAEAEAAIVEAVGRADRLQAVSGIRTMRQNAFASTERRRVFVGLIGLFGAIAVILAVIGVYGVMSNVVHQRYNELGIRIALGANPGQIRRLVIRHGGVLIAIGLAAGIAVSLAMGRLIRSMLFGASPTDPLTFTAGILLVGGAAFLACYIPARRASRIDALTALRHY